MKKLAIMLTFLTAGCTAEQIQAWHAWHHADKQAAEIFANEASIQAELASDAAQSPIEASQGTLPPVSPGTLPPISEEKRGIWDELAMCEAGGNWAINTGNGYFGGLQFSLQSWHGVGGTGYPHQASREEQIRRGEALLELQGWRAWPACSRKLGLR